MGSVWSRLGRCGTFQDYAGSRQRAYCGIHDLTYVVSQQPYTSQFPRADIHELLSPDILHQLVKGTFKHHLVTWVEDYLIRIHGTAEAKRIMDDIDRR